MHKLLGVLSIACVFSTAAHAQATEADSADAAETVDSETEARMLFDSAQDAYREGSFERALALFQASYDLSGRAELLYNVGLAAERTRDDERALRAFEEFVAAVPDSERRAFAETRIQALRASLAPADEDTPVVSEPPPEPPSRPLGGFLVAGGGVALAVAGTVMLVRGVSLRDEVENAEPGTPFANVEGNVSRAPALIRDGEVLLAIGAAAAVAGVVIAIVQRPRARAVEVAIGPTRVTLSGSF